MKKFARYNTGWKFHYRINNGIFCIFSLLPLFLSAQSDSIQTEIKLPETTIQEPRFNRTGYAVWQADSLPLVSVNTLANRLFWENGISLRQNGPGTLASISARGAGPNRTAVLWNGLSLQSPMNGQVDAALLPLWPGDHVEVLQGGNSAALSSGAMGGSVMIESPCYQERHGLSGQLGVEGGSFGWKAAQGTANYATAKIVSGLRANWQSAQNDFPFQKTGLDGRQYTTRQQNNFAERTDIQQFNQWIINSKNSVKTAVWLQNAFRRIPPSTTEAASDTWQRDRSGRAVATWEFNPDSHSRLQTRLAWQDEFIAFHLAGKTDESHAQTALLGLDWRKRKSRTLEWRLGSTAQRTRAMADGYRDKNRWYTQTRVAGFAQGEKTFGRGGKVSMLLRQEWAEAQAAPFTWTLGWEIPMGKPGRVRGHISRSFNLPTFNDRFWETLDSSTLVPEKGYSADLGWAYKKRWFSAEITGFQLILDDWILWQPGPDGLFRPGNLRKVSSRGLEAATSAVFHGKRWRWKAKAHMQWLETTNVAVYAGSNAMLGKQLPYTPKISAGGGIWAERGGFSGAYLHQYTGSRFITSDGKTMLPGNQMGTLMLRYDVGRSNFWRWSQTLALNFTLENIWNVAYESLANRPMPGRNWRAGIVIGW